MVKTLSAALLAALVAFFVGFGFGANFYEQQNAGTGVEADEQQFNGGVYIGDANGSSTKISTVLFGTCTLAAYDGSLEATSTDRFGCEANGVAAGDKIFGQLADSGQTGLGGLILESVIATTSNRLGVMIFNATGAATSTFAQATSSFDWMVIK